MAVFFSDIKSTAWKLILPIESALIKSITTRAPDVITLQYTVN